MSQGMPRAGENAQPMKVELILWEDASSIDQWTTREEVENKVNAGFPVLTIGLLIYETAYSVAIANSCLDKENESYCETMVIPKTQIRLREIIFTNGELTKLTKNLMDLPDTGRTMQRDQVAKSRQRADRIWATANPKPPVLRAGGETVPGPNP